MINDSGNLLTKSRKLITQAASGVSYSLIMKEPLIFYHSAVFAKSKLRRANLFTSKVDLPAADH